MHPPFSLSVKTGQPSAHLSKFYCSLFLQQVVLQPEPERVPIGPQVEPRVIRVVAAAHIHRRAYEQVEVAEEQAVPVRLGQNERLLGIHRVGERKQRL